MVVSPAPSFTPSTIPFSVHVPDSGDVGGPSDDEFLVQEPGSGNKQEVIVERLEVSSLKVLDCASWFTRALLFRFGSCE